MGLAGLAVRTPAVQDRIRHYAPNRGHWTLHAPCRTPGSGRGFCLRARLSAQRRRAVCVCELHGPWADHRIIGAKVARAVSPQNRVASPRDDLG